jgi:hypothetical protein
MAIDLSDNDVSVSDDVTGTDVTSYRQQQSALGLRASGVDGFIMSNRPSTPRDHSADRTAMGKRSALGIRGAGWGEQDQYSGEEEGSDTLEYEDDLTERISTTSHRRVRIPRPFIPFLVYVY